MSAEEVARQLAYLMVEGELIAKLDTVDPGSAENVEIINTVSRLRALRGAP